MAIPSRAESQGQTIQNPTLPACACAAIIRANTRPTITASPSSTAPVTCDHTVPTAPSSIAPHLIIMHQIDPCTVSVRVPQRQLPPTRAAHAMLEPTCAAAAHGCQRVGGSPTCGTGNKLDAAAWWHAIEKQFPHVRRPRTAVAGDPRKVWGHGGQGRHVVASKCQVGQAWQGERDGRRGQVQ
ncbi:hypothetical protein BCR44DRAFT_38437 [Catenaria anguillulae PL171]|uniref:Uncharacterized protein n=1 Tax=Catenaria anguillulae PL171 TaxID=765915 RepID=A0A1Y2HPB1_9FUNG|nr:hypothetical protein BCR44DRAFT_38437 [Catenaria anguillulae PL171]